MNEMIDKEPIQLNSIFQKKTLGVGICEVLDYNAYVLICRNVLKDSFQNFTYHMGDHYY